LVVPWIAASFIVFLLSCAAPFLPGSRRPAVRLCITLVLLAGLSVLLSHLVGSPVDPHFDSTNRTMTLSEKVFVALWWLLVARTMIASGQIALKVNHAHRSSRLASDLASAIVYLGAAIAILDLAFGISVTGLIATSGIIAIVLGLALQSTLGDLFSGIAIGIDRPFKVGDVVMIEGAAEGRVVETNWRSTRVTTATNDIATIPNSVIAKSRITNRSAPSESHMGSVKIILDPAVPPARAIAVLQASIRNAELVSDNPAPIVACTDLTGDGAVYEISFSAPLPKLVGARSDLLNQVARHVRYNGIAFARTGGVPITPVQAPGALEILDDLALLDAVQGADRANLAARLARREGGVGETLFVEGGTVTSLFVIAKGAFEVSQLHDHGPHRLGTLGPGDFIGEMALLMGTPNAATVRALTPFAAYELTKEMMAPLLEKNPELVHALEAGASRAQAMLDRAVATQACPKPATTPQFVDRIRAFFGVETHFGEISIKGPGLGTDAVSSKPDEGFESVVRRATVV
jgi:small-conductance mechanosensitive channel/CRP-like cAMP-binding protein